MWEVIEGNWLFGLKKIESPLYMYLKDYQREEKAQFVFFKKA